jgi:hypothetical protein
MQHIKNLIKSDDPAQSIGLKVPEINERERAKTERVMDRLWLRLAEIYGHQLVSQYGETIPESWELLLKEVTPDQIKDGLNNLVNRKDTWPPNAQEFRQLCLPKTISPDGTNSQAYIQYKPAPQITDQGAISKRKKAGRKALSEMMKGL